VVRLAALYHKYIVVEAGAREETMHKFVVSRKDVTKNILRDLFVILIIAALLGLPLIILPRWGFIHEDLKIFALMPPVFIFFCLPQLIWKYNRKQADN
jgi:hypothetical protein